MVPRPSRYLGWRKLYFEPEKRNTFQCTGDAPVHCREAFYSPCRGEFVLFTS
jgi:hypothetical protein